MNIAKEFQARKQKERDTLDKILDLALMDVKPEDMGVGKNVLLDGLMTAANTAFSNPLLTIEQRLQLVISRTVYEECYGEGLLEEVCKANNIPLTEE